MKYKFLPHLADVKIKVYGKDVLEIIENSLLALKAYFRPRLNEKLVKKKVEIKSKSQVELLADFLSEVLAQTYIKKAIFTKFRGEISETEIKGEILGYKFKKIFRDIKAITYHQTVFQKIGNNFVFEFIIDV